MKASDKPEFVRKLNRLTRSLPKTLLAEDYDNYWHALKNFKVQDIDRAMWWFTKNRMPKEFYPSPAEMRSKIVELTPRPEALPDSPATADDQGYVCLGAGYSWQCIQERIEFTHEGFIEYMRSRNCSDEWIEKMTNKYAEDE